MADMQRQSPCDNNYGAYGYRFNDLRYILNTRILPDAFMNIKIDNRRHARNNDKRKHLLHHGDIGRFRKSVKPDKKRGNVAERYDDYINAKNKIFLPAPFMFRHVCAFSGDLPASPRLSGGVTAFSFDVTGDLVTWCPGDLFICHSYILLIAPHTRSTVSWFI